MTALRILALLGVAAAALALQARVVPLSDADADALVHSVVEESFKNLESQLLPEADAPSDAKPAWLANEEAAKRELQMTGDEPKKPAVAEPAAALPENKPAVAVPAPVTVAVAPPVHEVTAVRPSEPVHVAPAPRLEPQTHAEARVQHETLSLAAELNREEGKRVAEEIAKARSELHAEQANRRFLRSHQEQVNEEGQKLYARIQKAQDELEHQTEHMSATERESRERSEAAEKKAWRDDFSRRWTPVVPLRFRQVPTEPAPRVTVGDIKKTLGLSGVNTNYSKAFDKQVLADKATQADRESKRAKFENTDLYNSELTATVKLRNGTWERLAALEQRKYQIGEEGRKLRYRNEDKICRKLERRLNTKMAELKSTEHTALLSTHMKLVAKLKEHKQALRDKYAATQSVLSQYPNATEAARTARDQYRAARSALRTQAVAAKAKFRAEKEKLLRAAQRRDLKYQARIQQCWGDLARERAGQDKKGTNVHSRSDLLEAEWEAEKQYEEAARQRAAKNLAAAKAASAKQMKAIKEKFLNATAASFAKLTVRMEKQTARIKQIEAAIAQQKAQQTNLVQGLRAWKSAANETERDERNEVNAWKKKHKDLKDEIEHETEKLRKQRAARRKRLRDLIRMRQKRDETNRAMRYLKKRILATRLKEQKANVTHSSHKMQERFIKEKLVLMSKKAEAEAQTAATAELVAAEKERAKAANHATAAVADAIAAASARLAANVTTVPNATVVATPAPRMSEFERLILHRDERKGKRLVRDYYHLRRLEGLKTRVRQSLETARLDAKQKAAQAVARAKLKVELAKKRAEAKAKQQQQLEAYKRQQMIEKANRDMAVRTYNLDQKLERLRQDPVPPLSIVNASINSTIEPTLPPVPKPTTPVLPPESTTAPVTLRSFFGELKAMEQGMKQQLTTEAATPVVTPAKVKEQLKEFRAAAALAKQTADECAVLVAQNTTEFLPQEMFRDVNVTVYDYKPLQQNALVRLCKPKPICKRMCAEWGWPKKCWHECINGDDECTMVQRPRWVTLQNSQPTKTYSFRVSDGLRFARTTVTRMVPKCVLSAEGQE